MTLLSLTRHLKSDKNDAHNAFKKELKQLQLKILRIQQGIWQKKRRVIIVFEGFDAAGKGGAIRKLTHKLDPRGFMVHPIGAPTAEEKQKHWLYRFWSLLPNPGTIAIFDRSWYGRVLVEKVDGLTEKVHLKRAYREINEFEQMLINDGFDLIKIFMAVSKGEQLKRFEDRLKNPSKQWKYSEDDLRARKKWRQYVDAVDEMFLKTHLTKSPWSLVASDHKPSARKKVLSIVTTRLKAYEASIVNHAVKTKKKNLRSTLKKLIKE